MPLNRLFQLITIGLVAQCVSCGTDRDSIKKESADASLPVIRITADDTVLPFGDVELTLEIVSRDDRDLPKEIRVTFRNKSATRGCLALPRPVVEDHDYVTSLPCLCIGMRGAREFEGSSPPEPFFLYAIPRGESAGPLEGVYLEPRAHFARRYALTSFCVIGHGIAPKPTVNFLALHGPGDKECELRAYVITDWTDFTRVESNPVAVRTSELKDLAEPAASTERVGE